MAFEAHIFSEKFNCSTKCANCLVVLTCGLIYRMCRVIAKAGEIVKSCSIAIIGNVSVLNFIFQY